MNRSQHRRMTMSRRLLDRRLVPPRPAPLTTDRETVARRRQAELERALQADELDELNAHDAGRLRQRP